MDATNQRTWCLWGSDTRPTCKGRVCEENCGSGEQFYKCSPPNFKRTRREKEINKIKENNRFLKGDNSIPPKIVRNTEKGETRGSAHTQELQIIKLQQTIRHAVQKDRSDSALLCFSIERWKLIRCSED